MKSDKGTHGLSETRVGHGHYGGVADRCMPVEYVLDLLRADVLTAANDQVLCPARDRETTAHIEATEVASVEESVFVKRVVQLPGIAHAQLGPASHDLALFPNVATRAIRAQ